MSEAVCRSCQGPVPSEAKDCPSCGQPQLHPCPYCSELIRMEAIKCKHCKSFIDGRNGPGGTEPLCPFCQQPARTIAVEQISTAGWVIFAVLIMTCIPLCWIGLLMKETKQKCSRCGMIRG